MTPARILRTERLRAVEQRFLDRADPPLMERAGAAAATMALEMIGAAPLQPILVVAGPGNNGGDALVTARLLKESGHAPTLVLHGDVKKLPHDARAAYDEWLAVGGRIAADIPDRPWSLIIDGLFGIGLTRPLTGAHAALVERINASGCPVLALDVPSGLDAETGRVLGIAVRATRTLTFIAGKPGLYTLDGPDHGGKIVIDALGLDFADTDGVTNDIALFRDQLIPRRQNSHKGSYGNAGIIGGAPGMAGAALLAGRAALKLGAGRVFVGMLERLPTDPGQPELMLREADSVPAMATALAVGPGLGQSADALALLRQAIATRVPLVADADALNLLAAHPALQRHVARREAPTLLTPHPLEAARLLGTTVDAVQDNRIAAALDLAVRLRAVIALKGRGTVIADADGFWAIETAGNPGLASAGSGDTLTGIAVALLAQHWPTRQAALAAVHLHARAADALVASGTGPVGLTAGELIDSARHLLNRWIADA